MSLSTCLPSKTAVSHGSGSKNVFKRGAIYWRRRRLPDGTSSRALVLIEISLRTKSVELAKLLAAEVTLVSEHLIRDIRRDMITPEDATRHRWPKGIVPNEAPLQQQK